MKKNRSNKSNNIRLTRWIDRLLQFQFDIEHLPGAKKASAYDEEFIVAKLKLISASINSLELNKTKPATHLHQLLKEHDPASQFTPKI